MSVISGRLLGLESDLSVDVTPKPQQAAVHNTSKGSGSQWSANRAECGSGYLSAIEGIRVPLLYIIIIKGHPIQFLGSVVKVKY